MEAITGTNTKLEVEVVEPAEKSFLLEWRSDAMDRGSHNYDTSAHSELVVNLAYRDIDRGDVIFYKTPAAVYERYPESPEDYNMDP